MLADPSRPPTTTETCVGPVPGQCCGGRVALGCTRLESGSIPTLAKASQPDHVLLWYRECDSRFDVVSAKHSADDARTREAIRKLHRKSDAIKGKPSDPYLRLESTPSSRVGSRCLARAMSAAKSCASLPGPSLISCGLIRAPQNFPIRYRQTQPWKFKMPRPSLPPRCRPATGSGPDPQSPAGSRNLQRSPEARRFRPFRPDRVAEQMHPLSATGSGSLAMPQAKQIV